MKKQVAILNSKIPFADNTAKDSLDIALIFGSYEQPISLFFHDDAVWQLISQTPSMISQKDFLKTFSAFELYDIENVYICQRSLNERNLPEKFHIDNVQVLAQADFNSCLAKHDVIFRF